jgi:hypothetical protein
VDNAPTGLTVTTTPALSGYVSVFVLGWKAWVANGAGEQATADCWFDNGGGVARAYGAVAAGDPFRWNAVQAGFDLVNGTHYVDFDYTV